MGEVSGDSSSPLLQIPSPISPMQRAALRCQAPTQPLCRHTHRQVEHSFFPLPPSYISHTRRHRGQIDKSAPCLTGLTPRQSASFQPSSPLWASFASAFFSTSICLLGSGWGGLQCISRTSRPPDITIDVMRLSFIYVSGQTGQTVEHSFLTTFHHNESKMSPEKWPLFPFKSKIPCRQWAAVQLRSCDKTLDIFSLTSAAWLKAWA